MSDNLFSISNKDSEPLAYRMRPRTIDEYVGQDHILGKGRLLRRAIQMDRLSSVIFYGPPGTGKTTLARVIANTTKSHFSTINAVLSGVKELRDEIEEAKKRRDYYSIRTILFVDEVHRWNKSQQDALLPWVENGTFILIGATTENPYFEVNQALVSRSRIFQLKKLEDSDLFQIAQNAISDQERGYGKYQIEFESGALEHLVAVSQGDARTLLNALELAVETTPSSFPPKDGEKIYITKENAEESIQKKAVLYDKEGDYHFDVISAFIKSIRGSDPDATLYWLARMISAGEDPRFIFRRMLISATEDVGMADPNAIVVVNADAMAYDRIGLPEGRFHLSHAALYLATCPKTNTTLGFFDALKDVEREKNDEVPNHLKDSSRDKEGFGHGEGYLYPHSYKDHWVAQQYLPTSLQGKIYYKPTDIGYEKTIRESVLIKREAQLEALSDDLFLEQYTFSPFDKKRNKWIERAMSNRSSFLISLTNELYSSVCIMRHENVLVLNAGNGLLLFPLMRKNPEGLSIAFVKKEEEKEIICNLSKDIDELSRPEVIIGEPNSFDNKIEEGMKFALISGRNVLSRLETDKDILSLMEKRLEDDGDIALLETIPILSSKLSDFAEGELKEKIKESEKELYSNNPLFSWNKEELEEEVRAVFPYATFSYKEFEEERRIDYSTAQSWYKNTYSNYGIDEDEFISTFSNRVIKWKSTVALIRGGRRVKKYDKSKEDFESVVALVHGE